MSLHVNQGGVDGAASGQFDLPGATASTVYIASLLNSLPRWVLKCSSALQGFLQSILANPRRLVCRNTSERCPNLWPMPIPYPECFCKGNESIAGAPAKKLVSMQVVTFSWIVLGRPRKAPDSLALGSRLSAKQWSIVKYLEHLSSDGNTPNSVDAAFMGRAAAKMESMELAVGALARAAAFLQEEEKNYFSCKLSRPDTEYGGRQRMGKIVSRFAGSTSIAARPLIATRLHFPGPPRFDPSEYFDTATRQLYRRPLDFAGNHFEFQGVVPAVRIFADEQNKLAVYEKLAASGRLKPVREVEVRKGFLSGLFSVPKDLERDRMVLDGRPPNVLEDHSNLWCGAMASPTALNSIFIEDDKVLLSSGEDLRDFFYQFAATPQRIVRNTLADPLPLSKAPSVFGEDFSWDEDPVWVGLASLAMGDCMACEYAQCSHVAICLKHQVCISSELITLKDPLPRGLLQVGIIIDDLVVLEQVLRTSLQSIQDGSVQTAADVRLGRAQQGYSEACLETNPKKRFSNQLQSRFWGVEVDGDKGLLRASSTRLWGTMLISLRVAQLGLATISLLESLAGSWIALLGPRRRFLCLMDVIFDALTVEDQKAVVRLSHELKGELLSLAILAPLATMDLRAAFSDKLIATDASLDCIAAVRATIPVHLSKELCRTALVKGRWTKLLNPSEAWQKQHDCLSPDEEVEEPYVIHPLWELCARGFQFSEAWRQKISKKSHINILEAKAFLKEERRLACLQQRARFPTALDSQVCLGALVKGRSSSSGINALLKRNLPYPIGAGIYNFFMYFASKLNRADAPTRDREIPGPDVELPAWVFDSEEVFLQQLDGFLKDCGSSQESVLPFHHLNGGDHVDFSPKSRDGSPKSKRDKAAHRRVSASSSTGGDAVNKDVEQLRPCFFPENDDRSQQQQTLTSSMTTVPEGLGTRPASRRRTPCSSLSEGVIQRLKRFKLEQFVGLKSFDGLRLPGALDLYSGNFNVAKQMVRFGCPWCLTFDIKRSDKEDLLNDELQLELLDLCRCGAFFSVGMAPICASFSRAITPAVRSRRWPKGIPGCSDNMVRKVLAGNRHAAFCLDFMQLAELLSIPFWLENPDTSFIWIQRGYKKFADPASDATFRLAYCRFGTRWKKNTRVATSTKLAGLRMMCQCGGLKHQVLRGYSVEHGMSWTSLAEPYPRGFARLLALACCVDAGWTSPARLNVAGCARIGTLRAGEASHPGPPKRSHGPQYRGSLHDLPILSSQTLAMESRLLSSFIAWCGSEIKSMSCEAIFDAAPLILVYLVKCYGDLMFQRNGSLSNFRHLLLAIQRWKPAVRTIMQPAWDYVARWELQEPVNHRIPVPETLVRAMIVTAWTRKWFAWAAATTIAFYGGGRLGEILKCARQDLLLPCDFLETSATPVFVRLRSFKSRTRQPARVQHLRVVDETACRILSILLRKLPEDAALFETSHYQYRKRWDALLRILNIPSTCRLTPGGLRGGYAVWAYRAGHGIQDIMWSLRLRSQITLEAYLQEAAALNCFATLPADLRSSVIAASKFFSFLPAATF